MLWIFTKNSKKLYFSLVIVSSKIVSTVFDWLVNLNFLKIISQKGSNIIVDSIIQDICAVISTWAEPREFEFLCYVNLILYNFSVGNKSNRFLKKENQRKYWMSILLFKRVIFAPLKFLKSIFSDKKLKVATSQNAFSISSHLHNVYRWRQKKY